MKHYSSICLITFFLILLTHLAHLAPAAHAEEKWQSLFNGKDLTGWKSYTKENSFTVVDGCIRAQTKGHAFNHLYYVGDLKDGYQKFKNFELEVTVKAEPSSNSGIYIHSDMTTRSNRNYLNTGYEIQLNNTAKEKKKTGSLYDVVNLDKSVVDETKWFKVNIKVVDKHITVSLNGKQVIDYTEPDKPVRSKKRAGRILRPEGGAISLQAHDAKSVYYFKEIKIKQLLR